jgi:uncharacterized membrane protein
MSRLRTLLRRRERGDIYAFWAVALPFLLLMLAVVIEIGRYVYLRSQAQTAADAAALAAASQIDIPAFENGQGVIFNGMAFGQAEYFMGINCLPLTSKGGSCKLEKVEFDESANAVKVSVTANLSMFFPSFVPARMVRLVGYAQVAPFTR